MEKNNIKLQQYMGYDGIKDTIIFEIDTINKCNFNCPYCEMQNNSWNPSNDKIDWGKTQNILLLIPFFKKLTENNIKYRIHLLGGEPTLHKDLKLFIESLPNSDIKIFTNGSNINKLIELSNIINPPSITISIHPNEYKYDYFKQFIINDLHNKFKNVKFLGILYDLDKYFDWFDILFSEIKNGNINLDMYAPFDENGVYPESTNFESWDELDKYVTNKIKLNSKDKTHLDIYKERASLSSNKKCYKNLWLINYKGEFHMDGSNIKLTLDEAILNINNFKLKVINCDKPCWCPANNYYTKIRL